jgi:hypothetical protein
MEREIEMKVQLWYCDACEAQFAVSDVERERVRCTVADVWPEIVLPAGGRFGLEDAKKAADADAERVARLAGYGWPKGEN